MKLNMPTFIHTSRIRDITHCPETGQYRGDVVLSLQDASGMTQDVSVKAEVLSNTPLDGASLALKFTRAAARLWRLCEVSEVGFGNKLRLAA